MPDLDASINTHLLEEISDQDQLEVTSAATQKLRDLIKIKSDDYRALLASDEYRNSPYIKKLRKLDRDRQADGNWNEKRREEYAQAVQQLFDREVRAYVTGLSEEEKSERRRDQYNQSKQKKRAAQSPEQTTADNLKRSERRRRARAAKAAIIAST